MTTTLAGETHLFDTNDPPATSLPTIDWMHHSLAGADLNDILLTFPHSTVTLLIVQQREAAKGDFDQDGDVDQSDFGHLQACFSGPGSPQNDPFCQNALIDIDTDVDLNDFSVFQRCISGSNIAAYPNCSD